MAQQQLPRLRFPGFEGEWEMKSLEEVSAITTGSTPNTAFKEYYNGNRMFISPTDINDFRYIKSTKTTLTELGFSKGRKIKKGSVCFVCIGSTIGKLAIVSEECLTNQQINSLYANQANSNEFIYSLLEVKSDEIKLKAGVQAIPQINKTDFSKLKFSFPPLPEQQKIASFLSAVDERVQLITQQKTVLERYKQGVMQQLFARQIRFKQEDGSDFPEWEEKRLGDLGEFIGGGTPESSNPEYWNGNIPWISSSDLAENSITKISITRYISEEALTKSATKLVPKGSVLMISRVGVGKFAVAEVELCTSQDFTNLVTNQHSYFLAYLFSYQSDRFKKLSQGTSILGFTIQDIKNTKFRIPTIPEQQKIASFLTSIDAQIAQVNKQLEGVKRYKKGLLQQLFV